MRRISGAYGAAIDAGYFDDKPDTIAYGVRQRLLEEKA
jgi:hypothetical protein